MINMKMVFSTNCLAFVLLLVTLLDASTGYPSDRTRRQADNRQRGTLSSGGHSSETTTHLAEQTQNSRPHARQRRTTSFDADRVLAASLWPSFRTAEPGAAAATSLGRATEHAHKRQQGWHTPYGKRQVPGGSTGAARYEDVRAAAAKELKRQLGQGLARLYEKRGYGDVEREDETAFEDWLAAVAAADVQKRQQTKYGARESGLATFSRPSRLDQLQEVFRHMASDSASSAPMALHSARSAARVMSSDSTSSSENDDIPNFIKRQQGWHTQFGKRLVDNGAMSYDDVSSLNNPLYDVIDDFVVKKQKRRLGWDWLSGDDYDEEDNHFSLRNELF